MSTSPRLYAADPGYGQPAPACRSNHGDSQAGKMARHGERSALINLRNKRN